ncbi:CHAT domain-containing protein [Tolypothrix sp. PCC 7910]|uniref:AAA-like domain-containing protein n=1 Tax=Tolypothrix sp. PCC 7910 TaxID=2099387 RepID=UPI0014279EB3|nr:AAA-like domain-containing protein [Tolypothrix sp. PCC 7910]QIR40782.1 CHAT domain-containing protein [Tolypothrix sp. PCC 7910]
MNSNNQARKILLLSANPKGTSQLRLGEEMREIKDGLKRAKKRDDYSIDTAEAVRYRDIHRAILEYEPHIIHFSGHGSGEEGLLFEDETGQVKLVDTEALAGLFQLFANRIECVVLNACYSKYQTEEIARHIDYVVGMNQAIGDKAAVEFAVGFYDALGAGQDYEFAYKLGCSVIRVAGIPQNLIPQLITKKSLLSQISPQELSTNSGMETINIYIKRPPIEEKCHKAILQPGALIRIKAPQKMGKTLLLEKLLDYARQQGYQTAKLDLKLADSSAIADLKTFLQWLCINVSDSLELEAKLDEYWQDTMGLNTSCTRYFQKYLLSVIDSPIVLAIDNFERLFKCENIFSEFCLLLRSWYETAKQGDRMGKIWKKLRLVVVNSTETYPTLDTNRSPFNVGLAIELPEFNQQQIEEMVKEHELDRHLGEQGLNQLMGLLGGHPYLLQETLSNLKNQEITLEEILTLAPTEQGIFSHHLREQLKCLQDDPQLAEAYKRVVTANEPVQLNPEITFKMHSLGLVNIVRNDCVPSCDLYRKYFSVHLR